MKTDKNQHVKLQLPVRYLAVTALCLAVSIIYGFFSHGVSSFWMSRLALWPFIFGAVPAILMSAAVLRSGEKKENNEPEASPSGSGTDADSPAVSYQPEEVMKDIYRYGIASVTVSSFLKGVLEIAGTDSVYPDVLLYAGAVMLLCGAAGFFLVRHRKKRR